jgi:hypothetical protein
LIIAIGGALRPMPKSGADHSGKNNGLLSYRERVVLQLLQKIGRGLKTAGPQRIFDVMVILSSIIRPASNANIHELLRRFYGGKFTHLHPKLEPILGETYGLFVYQEHVNLVAMELAGFSEVEGDRLRKALTGKKSDAQIRALMSKYAEGCRRNNIPDKVIKETAAQILNFGITHFERIARVTLFWRWLCVSKSAFPRAFHGGKNVAPWRVLELSGVLE